MAEFVANFELNNNSIDASFDLSEGASFDALFEVYASGTTWGNISGNIENQTDLQEALSELSGNIGELENTVTDNYNELSGAIDSNHQAISNINSTIEGYGDIVTYDAADFATSAQGAKADTALQPGDDISELNNNEGYITSAAIGDGTLTIQVNNQTVGTFAANQSGNTTANIEVPDSATWGNITGDIEDQTDLTTALASKQDALTPGTDIEITQDNTINFTNASGYITGISGTDVTNALGYTPYNATNPDKFIVNKANGSGSVTILGTAANGTNAVNIGNGAYTAGYAVSIGNSASSNGGYSISIGSGANTYGASSVAIGRGAKTNSSSAENALALGRQAEANAKGAIQLGKGTNTTANSMAIGFADIDGNGIGASYPMLDGTTGLIPDARISSNIARSADVATADDELQAQIDNLKARGRFLALWNCATGLAETNPVSSPYTYQTGDYFIVGVVSTATPPVNYRPDGSSYTTGVASTTVETAAVDVDDVYYYDGTTWHLQINTQKTTAFVNIAGSPYDNTELAQALNSKADNSDITNLETEISAKQDALTAGTDLEITQNNTINFTNASGYITGITSSDVTTALGYTPYDSSNPSGYTNNVGTVVSVNNTLPDVDGNVTISTGGTVDQTYDGTSANAQSGVAIAGAGFLNNTATGTSALTINGTATAKTQAINIGTLSQATANYGTTVGAYSYANGSKSSAFGNYARATADRAIQIGQGTNSTADTLQIGFNGTTYQLLDGTTGLIPDARISNNIARTSAIPTSSTVASWGFITGINSSDVTTALGYTPYNSSNPNGYITSSALSPYVLSSSLATVATSGSYNDLSNKPTIPAAQVNSDWNAVSGVAEILNKPNMADYVAVSDLTDVIAVIDDYTSGSIRVRTWSDGTKEQWCWRYTQSTAGAYTITYPVTFTTEPMLLTTYTLAATATTSTTTRNYGYATSASGFSVYLAANARLAWYARGK